MFVTDLKIYKAKETGFVPGFGLRKVIGMVS